MSCHDLMAIPKACPVVCRCLFVDVIVAVFVTVVIVVGTVIVIIVVFVVAGRRKTLRLIRCCIEQCWLAV